MPDTAHQRGTGGTGTVQAPHREYYFSNTMGETADGRARRPGNKRRKIRKPDRKRSPVKQANGG
jgi:hypothetical protein